MTQQHDGPSLVPESKWRDYHTSAALGFEPGCLNINKDGSGSFAFRESEIDREVDDESGAAYVTASFPAGEAQAIRDFLNGYFPPDTRPTQPQAEGLVEAVRQHGDIVVSPLGEGLGWRPVNSDGPWAALRSPEPSEEMVERVARDIEAALCRDAGRSVGAIWANGRGREQMFISARAAIRSLTEGEMSR